MGRITHIVKEEIFMLGMFAGLLGVATRCMVDAVRYGTPKKTSRREMKRTMQKNLERQMAIDEVVARHRAGLQEIKYVQMDGSIR